MCIMEVRAGQRSSTIAQAMAHNTSTIERDLDMLRPLLIARGETAVLADLDRAQEALRSAYERFLTIFAHECARDVDQGHGPDSGDVVGSERIRAEVRDSDYQIALDAMQAAHRAARYETRDVPEQPQPIPPGNHEDWHPVESSEKGYR